MITLSERAAAPVIETLLKAASAEIKEKTGVFIDWQSISSEMLTHRYFYEKEPGQPGNVVDVAALVTLIDFIVKKHCKRGII